MTRRPSSLGTESSILSTIVLADPSAEASRFSTTVARDHLWRWGGGGGVEEGEDEEAWQRGRRNGDRDEDGL